MGLGRNPTQVGNTVGPFRKLFSFTCQYVEGSKSFGYNFPTRFELLANEFGQVGSFWESLPGGHLHLLLEYGARPLFAHDTKSLQSNLLYDRHVSNLLGSS